MKQVKGLAEPSLDEPEADQAGGEQVEAEQDVEPALVADRQPAEAGEPGQRALHAPHPSQEHAMPPTKYSALTIRAPAIGTPLNRSWPAVLSIAAGAFFLVISEFLPIGMLTAIAQEFGVTQGRAGLTVTSPGLVAAVASPAIMLMAKGADRRTLLWLMTAIIIASNVVSALAPSYPVMIASRLLLGVGVGGLWTFAVPAARRFVDEAEGGKATALVAAAISLGLVIGVPSGVFIDQWFGWRAAFWMLAIFGIAVLVAQFLALRPIPVLRRLGLSDLLALFHVRKARIGLIALVLLIGGHFMAYTYFEPFLSMVSRFGRTSLFVALLVYGLAGIAGTFGAEFIMRKSPRLAFAGVAASLALTVFLMATVGNAPAPAFVLVVLWGCAFGAIPVCIQIWMYEAAPDAFEGGTALFAGIFQIALASGAFAGGLLVDAQGVRTTFIPASALAACAAIVIGIFGREGSTTTPRSSEA